MDSFMSKVKSEYAAFISKVEGDLAEALVDYAVQPLMIADRQVLHVYEELLDISNWIHGFAPHNILEIGTVGATLFLLSRLSTGKKVSVDIVNVLPKIQFFMHGYDWAFFQGDSQTPEMKKRVSDFCPTFDLIFIDADHSYDGVRRDFENYRSLLSDRGVILFHDVDPNHAFKGGGGGDVWRFWSELQEGSKTTLCCDRSSGRISIDDKTCHFGGFGIWRPER